MVSRDILVAYLLHEMPDEERAGLSERWMADTALYEQLQMVEAELLDAYACGQLSAAQRARVQDYLLCSESQRSKLSFAQALREVLRRPRKQVRWISFVAAAAMLILTAAGLWLGSQNLRMRHELAQLRRERSMPSGALYVTWLPADALRGSQQENRLVIPQKAEIVRLDLELEPGDENGNYPVSISASGQTIWNEGPIRSERRGSSFILPVWIPARILVSGIYEIRLGPSEKPVAYYHFVIAPG